MTGSALARVRLSESQTVALANRASPYRVETWTSERERSNRRTEPPKGLDAKVAWLRREWEAAMPTALHGQGIWTDKPSRAEQARGYVSVGSSELGAPALNGTLRRRIEESPHRRIEEDLESPLESAMAELRTRRRAGHSVVKALIYMAHFDWRSMADRPFYRVEPDKSRTLVRFMDIGTLEMVLDSSLELLWYLFTERESIAVSPP